MPALRTAQQIPRIREVVYKCCGCGRSVELYWMRSELNPHSEGMLRQPVLPPPYAVFTAAAINAAVTPRLRYPLRT